MSDHIKFIFSKDTYFEDLKEMEILNERINMLNNVREYVGTLFSPNFLKKNILKLTDEEISQLQDELDEIPKQAEPQEEQPQEPEQQVDEKPQ